MIILEKCDLVLTRMLQMTTGFSHVEGKALVKGPYEGGLITVQPSTGGAGEIFMGFEVGEPAGCGQPATSLPFQKTYTVPATGPYTITLPYDVVPGQIRVIGANGTALTAGTVAAGTYDLTGKVLTVDASRAGQTLDVRFNYAPTVGESLSRFGSGYPGGSANNQLGLTGTCYQGEIYTDQYDVSADWSNPTTVRLGANGMVTTSGSGVIIPDAKVTKLPTSGDAFIAIRF